MLDLVRRVPNRTERDAYVVKLGQMAGIDERILRDELSRGPRPIPVRPLDGANGDLQVEPRLSTLEREALILIMLNPTLAAELPAGERLPFRDEAALALADAWRAAIAESESRPNLETFVGGLDAATADLARALLSDARARGVRPDTESDRDELRICLLRLRSERIGERLADLQALIGAESQEGDSNDNHELQRQFQALSRERELVKQAINAPATVAGERRS